jgi:hypothetical protein
MNVNHNLIIYFFNVTISNDGLPGTAPTRNISIIAISYNINSVNSELFEYKQNYLQ